MDKLNNKHVKLSKADVALIRRLRQGTWADADVDPYDESMYFERDNKDWIHPFN